MVMVVYGNWEAFGVPTHRNRYHPRTQISLMQLQPLLGKVAFQVRRTLEAVISAGSEIPYYDWTRMTSCDNSSIMECMRLLDSLGKFERSQ
jgi:hypothetical protein